MIAKVIVDILSAAVDRVFDYAVPDALSDAVRPGARVLVPFAGRVPEGIVIALSDATDVPADKLKSIVRTLDDIPAVTEEMLGLMHFMCGKYHLLLADALRLFIPAQMRGGRVKEKNVTFVSLADGVDADSALASLKSNAAAQRGVLTFIKENGASPHAALCALFSSGAVKKLKDEGVLVFQSKRVSRTPYAALSEAGGETPPELLPRQRAVVEEIEKHPGGRFLLYGVTGSGKTEVYLNRIAAAAEAGKSAVMLVPEIALTPQMLRVFRARFGSRVAILHSGLSAGERFDEWHRLRTGEAVIAVGARSAIFAPLKNLGVIIIDEEHEQSYVSESAPRYDTRDIAFFRASQNPGCCLIMGSATPLVESFYKAHQGEYILLEMTERVNGREMPAVNLVDMRREMRVGNRGIFSGELSAALKRTLDDGAQAMLFINRRGFSPIVVCASCGYTARCNACDVTLNYHKAEEVLKCHYCGTKYGMLTECPDCGGKNIRLSGAGTQKVCELLKEQFPKARVLRMDNDTTQNKEAHLSIVSAFARREADILVGTQMIAKGHDFPSVTLVGVLDADLSLYFADYRSIERTFALITQVAGRAGRAEQAGEVILQTRTPHHYVYTMIREYDYRGFYKREIALRESAKYPPFARVMRVLCVSSSDEECKAVVKDIFQNLKMLREIYPADFIYLNAMRAPVAFIEGRFRYQVLMRFSGDMDTITDSVYDAADSARRKNVSTVTEVNPSNLY